jgi:hypothetical protein
LTPCTVKVIGHHKPPFSAKPPYTGCGERLDDLLATNTDILDLMGAAITDNAPIRLL